MHLGVWFHFSLGNDYLLEKLQALKMKKEIQSIVGQLVLITVKSSSSGFAVACNVLFFSELLLCDCTKHIVSRELPYILARTHTLSATNIGFSLNSNNTFPLEFDLTSC